MKTSRLLRLLDLDVESTIFLSRIIKSIVVSVSTKCILCTTTLITITSGDKSIDVIERRDRRQSGAISDYNPFITLRSGSLSENIKSMLSVSYWSDSNIMIKIDSSRDKMVTTRSGACVVIATNRMDHSSKVIITRAQLLCKCHYVSYPHNLNIECYRVDRIHGELRTLDRLIFKLNNIIYHCHIVEGIIIDIRGTKTMYHRDVDWRELLQPQDIDQFKIDVRDVIECYRTLLIADMIESGSNMESVLMMNIMIDCMLPV